MLLDIQNLAKSYGETQVLRGINLRIESDKDLSIVGSSGSGKSTLLYILGALERSDSGRVLFGNTDLMKLDDKKLARFRNETIGFVFQFHFLLPSMTCIDNILLPAKIGGKKIKEVRGRVESFAKTLQVSHCLNKYPFEISGGEQQRINIIRAISLSPKILLCDEPTGNLDSKNTEVVLELLRYTSREVNSKLIVVTHDAKVANSFDHKITIEDGQIIG